MDENKVNEQPNTDEGVQQDAGPEEKSMGAILGSIIVVIILLVAAFYLWGNKSEVIDDTLVEDAGPTAEEILGAEDLKTDALETQGGSDELDAIEADLEATDLEGLTQELEDIDKELGL